MKEILVVIPVKDSHKNRLEAAARDCHFTYSSYEDVTRDMVKSADIIVGNVPFKLIENTDKLELLQLNSAGADNYINPGVLPEKTILTNATGAYSKAVAEHTFAMLLALEKKLHLYRDNQNKALWEDCGPITSLADETVLVIGLGDIGGHFAKLCKAFGSYVIGVKRRPGDKPDYVDELYLTDQVMNLLPKADVICTILPGTEETFHFFTNDHFDAMKDTAIFLNAGRGSAVDSQVLFNALTTGQIKAAATDVTEIEPLPGDSPLWGLSNLLITPHISGGFHLDETFERIVDIAAFNISAFLENKPLKNIVDFKTGYKK